MLPSTTVTALQKINWSPESLSLLPETELRLIFKNLLSLERAEKEWKTLPGPQTQALESKADIIFYGGAAGGGKTDLLLGAAMHHKKAIIFRREFVQLEDIIERGEEIYAGRAKYNGKGYWRFFDNSRKIELGSCANIGDEKKYQGRPHDFIGFDEIPHFAESQFRTLTGWLRTKDPSQRCRVICAGNPPMSAEEEWVVDYWAPWLDPYHSNPARPGELRYYAMIEGVEKEVASGEPFELRGHMIRPLSRTFIPASVEDNPYYMATDYMSQLAALPEPYRSKLLYGDFRAGKEDNPWQVVPSEWVLAAQERWKAKVATGWKPSTPLSSLGIDVARGGKDETILSPWWDNFMGEQECHAGKTTPDGAAVAVLAINSRDKNNGNAMTNIKIDVIGIGSSPYDHTKAIHTNTHPMNGSEGTEARDKSGQLGFVNQRAQWYWQFREALDPTSGQDICLPPSRELYVDLCAAKWKPTARGIQIESKDDIIKRIKRSPDKGDSCIYGHGMRYFAGMGLLEVMRQQVEEKEREARERR